MELSELLPETTKVELINDDTEDEEEEELVRRRSRRQPLRATMQKAQSKLKAQINDENLNDRVFLKMRK